LVVSKLKRKASDDSKFILDLELSLCDKY